MTETERPTTRQLRLRYAGTCSACGIALPPTTEAVWNRKSKQATCLTCAASGAAQTGGAPGASAAAEAARRTSSRVNRVRAQHGVRAAVVAEQVALREAAATWQKGSEGESRLAAFIAREVGDLVIALHDRLMPGTRRNIDHVFVAPSGVWVVDAKTYEGRVVKRDTGSLWRAENKVYVGGRDRTSLAKGAEEQVACVLAALRLDPGCKGVEVHGALCFVDSAWGLFDFPFRVGSVWVLYPGALRKRLKKNGPLSRDRMEQVARAIALGLPPAAGR